MLGMMHIAELLNPKNDYVFKRIFGYRGNEDITRDFLEAITKEKITEIKLDCNPITEKDLLDDKVGILDIKVKVNNSINCNIEMQIVDRKNIEKRLAFYWGKMYTQSIKEGKDYDKLEKGIVILISDYNLNILKEVKKYMTKWNLREEEYSKLVLTDVMEIYIIELNKVVNNKENKSILKSWLQFINNPGVILDMENEEIKKARDVLKEISQDERERRLTELREKYIMDQKAIEDAGYDKGLEKGIQQGVQHERMQIAKKMKEEKMEISVIIKLTGLTKEEIENL